MPAGSKRMLPRIRKWADYGICLSCFDKWKLNGGDIVYINNTSPRKQAPRIKKEHVIHMSNILKGNCDIIKGRKLYVALKKGDKQRKNDCPQIRYRSTDMHVNKSHERHTRGTGYGSLLPTVQTQGLKVCDKDGKTRFMDLSSLPKQGIKYGDLLPTPVASDHTGSCTIRKMTKSNGAPRIDSLRNMPAVIGMDGDRLNGRVFQLSPLFVEEMMGYPLMWTTLPFLTGNGEKNQ